MSFNEFLKSKLLRYFFLRCEENKNVERGLTFSWFILHIVKCAIKWRMSLILYSRFYFVFFNFLQGHGNIWLCISNEMYRTKHIVLFHCSKMGFSVCMEIDNPFHFMLIMRRDAKRMRVCIMARNEMLTDFEMLFWHKSLFH